MEPYSTLETNESYSFESPGYASTPVQIRNLGWQKAYPIKKKTLLDIDTVFIEKMLTPISHSYGGLAEQVFGQQALREKLSLGRLYALLHERYQMHARHMSDIRRRNMEVQGELCGARWNANLDSGRRALILEKMWHDLEAKERQGELDFWKDTNELRQNILEKAAEYSATRRRTGWLGKLEENAYKP